MIRKLEDKGVVDHRVDGRQHIYRPTVAERDVQRTMVGEIVDRLFKGDAAALVSHLITEQGVDEEELRALTRQIEERRSESKERPDGR
jgi:predicted transcriptional regulator